MREPGSGRATELLSPRFERLREQCHDRLWLGVVDACEHVACELAADDGRHGEHPPAVLREQTNPPCDDCLNSMRERIEPAL